MFVWHHLIGAAAEFANQSKESSMYTLNAAKVLLLYGVLLFSHLSPYQKLFFKHDIYPLNLKRGKLLIIYELEEITRCYKR
uniref:Beta-1,3-galactosyltransferase sqv-2 n=1 Tax=Solanum tuberosum TaxID=4113 RepID=M1CW02_SOLTU